MRGMHIRGTKFGDVVDGFKLLLCTFFVFPIRFWIDQTTHSDLPNVCSNDAHYDHTTDPLDYTPINHPASAVQSSTAFGQWLHLVNAPVTKYWVSQLSYLISLMWFTAAMVQSGCGSIVLDRGVCIWLTCLHLENMRCRWRMRRSLLRSPANYWLEDVIALSFAFIFYLARLSPITGPLRPYGYHIRMAGACVLVYHYMKYMNIFLPMHPTLGPLFHHIRLLSLNDLLSFALLCWPFLAGFGVITEVAFYPDRYPFEPHNFQAMLHRTVSSLFKTPHAELAHSNDDCQARITNPYSNATFCRSASFDDVNCNHRGLFPIVFFTSFIFLVKIALITLLFALFNTSMIPLDKLTIWHFQRLNLITTFELINPLPPPFSPIMYMYWIGLRLSATLKRWTEKTPSPNRSDNQVCQQCSNESMLYFWQSIGKSSLEKVESEIV